MNKKAIELRRALTKYRGGHFETSGSGGANGMVFHRDRNGAQFYIGGFQEDHAQRIVEALNLTLEIIEDA